MIEIDIATLFPEMCENVLSESIIGRARKAGFIDVCCTDIRKYTENKHNRVDDKPYGGGTGMVMQAQPIYDCIKSIREKRKAPERPVYYMSPQGKTLTQQRVKELSKLDGFIILCGHYEGVDQRVLDELQVEEISVGDYVLTGGELPALILTDSVARLIDGVLPNSDAYSIESHYNGLLEHPQYSRPEIWMDRAVPEVLLSGDHKKIEKWQQETAFDITAKKRPDLLFSKRNDNKAFGKYFTIRFLGEYNNSNLFSVIHKMIRSKKFTNKEAKDFKKIFDWYSENFKTPNIEAPYTVWYKTDDGKWLARLIPLCDKVCEQGATLQIIFSDSVSDVICENDSAVFQKFSTENC